VYMGLAFPFLLGIAGITAIVYYLTIFFTDALIQREIKELAIGFFRPEHIDLIKRLSLFRYWN